MSDPVTRREFVRRTTAALGVAATAASARRVHGANERIRAGFIGVGNRGGQLIDAAREHKDLDIVAVCDVYQPYLDKWTRALGAGTAAYRDFRDLLDRDDIDAVFIATPDHWHALQTIIACDAGKDVYVEKPLSLTVLEGQRMIEAARRNAAVVQVGLQRRASTMSAELAERIARGEFGKITVVRAYRLTNMSPAGIGISPNQEPPAGLDWDMWLGPRPKRPFNPTIHPYKFRWWQAYSSQLGNWGVHYFDLLRWLIGEQAPASVSAHGGKFAVADSRTIPDTLHAIYEFAAGCLMLFGQYEASGNPIFARDAEVELRGTLATIYATTDRYEVVPESAGQYGDPAPLPEAETVRTRDGDLTVKHIGDFLDCMRSRRRPSADVEEGHLSTVFSHLGNIALATRSRIEWDAARERAIGNEPANRLLHYPYRKPWKLT